MKDMATSAEDAREKATFFISQLPVAPVYWKLTGSWANGTGRPGSSDVDIEAYFEGADEEVLIALYEDALPVIDFHWFCREWRVYDINPDLWNESIKTN